MNGGMIFVLCIIAICVFAGVAKTWLKGQQANSEPNEELEATLSKIDVLEERIRVLERIITENKYDLKSEIDSL